nr:phosphoribosylglycinamide formyltransferase [Halorhodospira halophila]
MLSGSGSNLQALLDQHAAGALPATFACVLSNRADAYGLQRAEAAGIPTAVVDHRQYPDREAFDRALAEHLEAVGVDLVVLAGFMRILTPVFVERFQGRLLNIHPSLLPDFRGLHTHERALEAGVEEHGCTVHFVTPELDAGPAIVQGVVPVHPGDSPEALAQRVQVQEHRVYPLAVRWFVSGRLALTESGVALDGQVLEAPVRVDAETAVDRL